MTQAKAPAIAVRGIRQSLPSGYVLGRMDQGPGAAQLVPLSRLGAELINSGQVIGPTTQEWQAGNVSNVDTAEIVINSNTLTFANRGTITLMGNPGTIAAKPSDIHIGANLTLSTSGTLSASGDLVTAVDNRFAVNSGTLALANAAAATLFGNSGTVSAEPAGTIAVGGGLSLSAVGTLSNTGILSLTGGTGISISGGSTITNSGIVSLVAGSNIAITGGNTIASTASGGVTSIVAGTGLTGGTITSSGTIALGPLGNSLAINGGTIDVDETPTYFSASRTLATTDRGSSLVDISTGTVDLVVTLPTFTAGTKLWTKIQNNSTAHLVRLRPGAGAVIDGSGSDFLLATFTGGRVALDNTGTGYVVEAGNIWWQPNAGYVSALGAGIQITNNGTFDTNGTLGLNLVAGAGITISGSNTIAATGAANVLFDMSPGVPALSAFTQFGTATITENLGKAITMKATTGTRNLNGITKAAPGTPYRLAMLLQLYIPQVSFPAFSFGFSDGTKYSVVSYSATPNSFQWEHWTNSTTRATNGATTNQTPLNLANFTSHVWFAIENDGTTVSFEYSPDGANWIVFQKETISGGFLANYNTAFVGVLPDTTLPTGFPVILDLRVWDVNGLTRKVG